MHAWNLVLLDGKWYHLDTTWDDPAPDRKGEIGFGYYLRTDAQMKKDHAWTKKLSGREYAVPGIRSSSCDQAERQPQRLRQEAGADLNTSFTIRRRSSAPVPS
ncbi:hypothetical protein VQ056_23700 [Paenibacillus sp. JTLBN-2024]